NGVRSSECGGHRTEPPRPRRSDNTNGLSCSPACCLYFSGPRDASTCDDSHSTASLSLPRHARRTL
ncbi:hypothetical protein AVEN_49654-1, partial [Araneus ventricosus]